VSRTEFKEHHLISTFPVLHLKDSTKHSPKILFNWGNCTSADPKLPREYTAVNLGSDGCFCTRSLQRLSLCQEV